MKALVTGGLGFIGSNLVDELVRLGYDVVIVDNLSTGKMENLNKKAKLYIKDIINFEELENIFDKEKPEIVFHLAAQANVRKSVENPSEDAKTNIIGSLNLLHLSSKYKVKKFIFSSSGGAVYGDDVELPAPENEEEKPVSPYGCAKLAVEKYIYYFNKIWNLDYVILRYANVYGPRQDSKGEAGVVAIFIDKMMQGINPEINGNGKQTRDFVYVDDVVKANIASLKGKGIFNISAGKNTSINELFDKINNLFSNKFKKKYAPAKLGEQMRSWLDISLAKAKLGWKPEVSLDLGLKKTFDWFNQKLG